MGLLMTATISRSASGLRSGYGNPTVDCGGAQIRAHCRHLATVVAIQGHITDLNVGLISEHTRRISLAQDRLVLDLSRVNSFAAAGISLLDVVDEECRTAGVEWTVVASPAVSARLLDYAGVATYPTTPSVHEALHHFADVIARRRQLLLPLIGMTA